MQYGTARSKLSRIGCAEETRVWGGRARGVAVRGEGRFVTSGVDEILAVLPITD